MGLTSLVSYIISGLLIWASFYIAEGNHFNILMFWDLSAFVIILAGLMITFVNFRFSEVYNAIADGLTKRLREGFEERYELNKIIIKSIGTYTLYTSLLMFFVALIIILGNLDSLDKLGASIAVAIIVFLYALMVRLFIVVPLNTSLDKKMTKVIK